MKSKSGFTLIELVVVLVVISILLGITAFAYSKQQAESRSQRRLVDAATLASEMDAHYQRFGNFPITCGLPSSNLLNLRSCSGSSSATSFYTGASMLAPHLIPANAASDTLKTVLPGATKGLRDPSASSTSPQLNHLNGSSIQATSYFLFSPDMIYSSGGATNTQSFTKPDGGILTCKYNLQAAANPQASLPHQYIIGVPNELTGSWSFYISAKTLDTLATTWSPNTSSDSACTPLSIDEL